MATTVPPGGQMREPGQIRRNHLFVKGHFQVIYITYRAGSAAQPGPAGACICADCEPPATAGQRPALLGSLQACSAVL